MISYVVEQDKLSHVTVLRTIVTEDTLDADGVTVLFQDEILFGQRAGELREGLYNIKGEFQGTASGH